MEFQYTEQDTEAGLFMLVRVFTPEDADLALGEHFLTFFTEEISDDDIIVIRRDEDGVHEIYSPVPVDFSDEELDSLLWQEGEWLTEDY
jgi:hypothetical protein